MDTHEAKLNSTCKWIEKLFTPCFYYLWSCKTKVSWSKCLDTEGNKQTNKSTYNTSILRQQIGELLLLFRCVETLWLETVCMSSVDSHNLTAAGHPITQAPKLKSNGGFCYRETDTLSLHVKSTWDDASLTLTWLMSYIYIWSTHSWCF